MILRLAFTLSILLLGLGHAQLTFWTTEVQPERLAVQEAIAADFEAATGISVELVPVEESALAERVTAAFGAGDLPDVIAHPVSQTIGWAEAGILDVEAASEVIADLGADSFAEGPLNLVQFQGDYAAVPSSGWTQLLVYRQDLFDEAGLEPPTSFANISAAIEALHNPPEMFGFVAATDASNDYMMQVLEHFFLANGVALVDDEGNISLDRDKTIEVLEFYKGLADASPEGNLFWEQSRELYLAGQAAMIVWSPFILDELAGLRDNVPVTATDDPTSSDLATRSGFVTSISGPSNPEGAGWASASYWGITVDADIDAAKQFVEFLATEGYTDWLSMAPEGLFPVRGEFTDAWAQLDVGVDRRSPLGDIYEAAVIDDIVAGLEVGDRWAFSQGEGALVSALYGTRTMAEAVRAFLDGERTAEQTVDLLQLEIEALR